MPLSKDELIESIRKGLKMQLYYYELISGLTAEEKKAIAESDENELMRILSRKKKFLDKVEEETKTLVKLRQEWDKIRDSISAEIKAEFKEITDKSESLLKITLETEKDNIENAKFKKVNWVAIIAFLIGFIVANVVTVGVIAVNAILTTMVVYVIGTKITDK